MGSSWMEYVDVLSNASTDLYKDNHGASFTNKLIVPQYLPENAYVGLSEISYNNSFYNITKEGNRISIFDWLKKIPKKTAENPKDIDVYGELIEIEIKEGYYNTPEKFCEMLNKAIQTSGSKWMENLTIFSYNEINQKFGYDVSNMWLTIFLTGDLIHMIGIERQQATSNQSVLIGKSKQAPTYEYGGATRTLIKPDWKWEAAEEVKGSMMNVYQLVMVQTLCVYCNIIESQKTGDSYSDIIRLVSIKDDKPGKQVVEHFDNPFYLKVNARFIPSITIWIRDMYGNEIDFKRGTVRVKLHFITKNEDTTTSNA